MLEVPVFQVLGPSAEVDWQLVVQLLSGGIAGSILTYALNQRLARRKTARVHVNVTRTDYSIPTRDVDLKPVEVSYGGKVFDKLLLYEFTVRNVSSRTAASSPFLFLLGKDMKIVDRSTATYPLRQPTKWEEQSGTVGAYIWDPGELKPDDYSVLRLLLTPAGAVEWRFRGDDDARVVAQEGGTAASLEADARVIILSVALFIALGALPFVSALLRGVLLVIFLPFLVNRLVQWRAMLGSIAAKRTPNLNIEMRDVTVEGDFSVENGRTTQR